MILLFLKKTPYTTSQTAETGCSDYYYYDEVSLDPGGVGVALADLVSG